MAEEKSRANFATMRQPPPRPDGEGRDITALVMSEFAGGRTVFWSPEAGLDTVHQWILSSLVHVKILLERSEEACPGVPAHPAELGMSIMDDLEARARMGEAKYGQRLRAHNGRDALVDLYQELLDAAVYSGQKREESGVYE